MAFDPPTASEIRSANIHAVGGGRKRCTKGKNCSAACIDAREYCLVGLPESVGVSLSRVASMIGGGGGGESAKPAAVSGGAPVAAPARSPRKKKNPDQLSLFPEATPAPLAPGGAPRWYQRHAPKGPEVEARLNLLSQQISHLPKDQQEFWNLHINRQMVGKYASARTKTPLPPEKTNEYIIKQANAWSSLITHGQPKMIGNRKREMSPAPENMIPNVTPTGQRKWIDRESMLRYGLDRGIWRQSAAGNVDVSRVLPDMVRFRDERTAAGQEWPMQRSESRRKDMPKSVDEIINGLSKTDRRKITENGLDRTSEEGIALINHYRANPKDA
ncbi:hypothetical protein EBX93_17675, partial [bacterium]|nr:hypothetical protein [bacterium]